MVIFAIVSVGKGWGAEDEYSTKTVILHIILNHSIPCKMVQEAKIFVLILFCSQTRNQK